MTAINVFLITMLALNVLGAIGCLATKKRYGFVISMVIVVWSGALLYWQYASDDGAQPTNCPTSEEVI